MKVLPGKVAPCWRWAPGCWLVSSWVEDILLLQVLLAKHKFISCIQIRLISRINSMADTLLLPGCFIILCRSLLASKLSFWRSLGGSTSSTGIAYSARLIYWLCSCSRDILLIIRLTKHQFFSFIRLRGGARLVRSTGLLKGIPGVDNRISLDRALRRGVPRQSSLSAVDEKGKVITGV